MGKLSKAATIYRGIDAYLAAMDKANNPPAFVVITHEQLHILNNQAKRLGPSIHYRSVELVTIPTFRRKTHD